MSVAAYSTCRIQFIPNDRHRSERNYSDRSIVELRQYDYADYSLRALDIENNKEEIFNIPIKDDEQYKRGRSANHPDEARGKNGTYHLWLNASARTEFHQALDICLEQIHSTQDEPPQRSAAASLPPVLPKRDIRFNNEQSQLSERSNQNNILVDVHQLSLHIRQGNVDEAVELAKKLARHRVRLQANPCKQSKPEKLIQIRVKIDSNDVRISNKHDDLIMDVYPSTTIRELRGAFEHTHEFPLVNQYFFVNGHLAHDNSTMTDLDVRSNSLFVLFFIRQ